MRKKITTSTLDLTREIFTFRRPGPTRRATRPVDNSAYYPKETS